MVGVVHCATPSFISLVKPTPPRRRIVVLVSSVSTSSLSNPTRRKNHLRPKLIKILKKTYPTHLIPESPPTSLVIPLEVPAEERVDSPSGQLASEEREESGTQELLAEASDATGALDTVKFSTRSVVKIGLYLVGAFLFQTFCAVWVYESASSDDKTRVLDVGRNGNDEERLKFLFNGRVKAGFKQGGAHYVDESELEKQIAEIQVMARDAREIERLGSKANDVDDDDDEEVVKTGIEKEVDSKLVKLRRRLQNQREKAQIFPVSYSMKDGKVEVDNLKTKDENNPLMFKKKYKFRSPSTNLFDKPKGFQSRNSFSAIEDETIQNRNADNDDVNLLGKEDQADLCNSNLQDSASLPSEEDGRRKSLKEEDKSFQMPKKKMGKSGAKTKLRKHNGAVKPQQRTGVPQANSLGRPLVKAVKPGKSSIPNLRNSQSLTKKIHESVCDEQDKLLGNSSLKNGEVGKRQTAGKVEGKHSNDKDDFWWLSLPYVLAILMGRGDNGEGPKGLFTLKSTLYMMDEGDMSHTVAFEDRGDATNFCYLLQSFFEDLGDFSAEIVPLSTEELNEAVRSHSMKAIVVKKGQIKLYVGQPLTEVEMALRSLVK